MSEVVAQEMEVVVDVKGFSEFREQVLKVAAKLQKVAREALIHGFEIGRLVTDFASKPELRAEVDRINKERQDASLGGRPKAYHCHVAELLVNSGLPLSKHWIESCARGYERSKALGYTVKDINKLARPGAYELVSPEQMLPAPEPEDNGDGSKKKKHRPSFRDFVKGFVIRLDGLEGSAGEVALRNKTNQEAWSDAVEKWFSDRGVTVQITFKA